MVGANDESNLTFTTATQQAATQWHEALVLAIRRRVHRGDVSMNVHNFAYAPASVFLSSLWFLTYQMRFFRSCLSVAIHQEHVLDMLVPSDPEEGTPNPSETECRAQ